MYNSVGDFNMKHNNKYLFSLLLLPLLGGLTFLAPQKASKVEAAYSVNTLPTTINLKDYSDNDIRSYYSNLNSLADSERTGENLLKNLKPILSNEQKYYKYDGSGAKGGDAIWMMYEITDRDWKKSPASSMTQGTYDAATNTITGYSYGSNSDKKDNPYVHALYVDRSVDNPKTAWTVHNARGQAACIEREHIWPKSHGFDADEVAGARGDPMHLWAADGYSNGVHNNYFYGNVDLTKTYKNTHDDEHAWNGNNYFGFSKSFPDATKKVFEPQDSDKGDIARACFYMVARYNNISGTDSSIDSANPNLALGNDVSKSEETGTSTATTAYELGVLKDLLEWNKLDPVDEYELHRNNLLYGNFTNNRNPFIDFPEWADLIWGSDKNIKFAAPSVDEIARPQDFVPPTEDTTPEKEGDGNIIPGVPNVVLYVAAAVVAVIVIVVVIVILTKGSKKQKKTLKKVAKKVVKSSSKKKK